MKYLQVLLVVLCLLYPIGAFAKLQRLQIDFAFEASAEPDIPHYLLYYTYLSDVKEYVMDVTDLATRTFDTIEIDLPVGKTVDLHMSALYLDGTESFSEAFPFKITGKPQIIGVRTIK